MRNQQFSERSLRLDLAEQRGQRGISLKQAADATKISLHFLQAIEAEEFQKLPGGVFNTSYIRQYARFTGLDEVAVLARYVNFVDEVNAAQLPPASGISRLRNAFDRILGLLFGTLERSRVNTGRKQHT